MAALKPFARRAALVVLAVAAGLLAGCGSSGRQDGAPGRRLDPDAIKDAVPRRDPITRAGNKNPYTVLGKTYSILPSSKGYRARGTASWYGTKFHGENTANGERYDLYEMTAAHCTLPIPTYVLVTNLENGRQCIVRVNDRGPFVSDRLIDLSYAAATKLGYVGKGTAPVEVVAIDPDDWPPRAIAQTGEQKTTKIVPPLVLPAPRETVPLSDTVSDAPVEPGVPMNGPAANGGAQQAPAPPLAAAGGSLYVQAGAFANNYAAENLRTRLAGATGYRVVVQPSQGGQVLYRVRVGPFSNAAEAEQALARVRAQRIDGARIVDDPAPR
jgi:rare lipoprotein A